MRIRIYEHFTDTHTRKNETNAAESEFACRGWSIWTDRLSLQASQLQTVSAGIGAVRSGAGSMGSVGTAVVSLSPVAASWPRFPLPTGMCKRKSWLCRKYKKTDWDTQQFLGFPQNATGIKFVKTLINYCITNIYFYHVLMPQVQNMLKWCIVWPA